MTTVTQGPCLSRSIAQLFRDELLRRLLPECDRDRDLDPLLRDFDDPLRDCPPLRLVLRCERDDPLECDRDRLCDFDDPLRLVLRCERDLLLLDFFFEELEWRLLRVLR